MDFFKKSEKDVNEIIKIVVSGVISEYVYILSYPGGSTSVGSFNT